MQQEGNHFVAHPSGPVPHGATRPTVLQNPRMTLLARNGDHRTVQEVARVFGARNDSPPD
jgi:hypothetical protein